MTEWIHLCRCLWRMSVQSISISNKRFTSFSFHRIHNFHLRVQSFSLADWVNSEFCCQHSLWDWKLCPKLSWNDMLYPLAFGWYFKLRKLYCGLSLKLIWEFNLRWQMTIVSNLSVEVENSERSHKTQSSGTFLSFRLSLDDWKIELRDSSLHKS